MKTPIKMRIEYVSPDRSGDYVFARLLEDVEFTLSGNSKLGGISILPKLSQPRALKNDGSIDYCVFAFHPTINTEKQKWIVGSEVYLEV